MTRTAKEIKDDTRRAASIGINNDNKKLTPSEVKVLNLIRRSESIERLRRLKHKWQND